MATAQEYPIPFGKYLLQDLIGRGGFANIFRATQQRRGGGTKQIAIKRIFPHLGEDSEFAQMFIHEAKLSAQLKHENIVQVHELGAVDGVLYIAMEYIDGCDLSHVLHQFESINEGMDPRLAAYIISRVAQALYYAHKRADQAGKPLKIIHRDVTPQNILLSMQGEVKLADFGIAKAVTSTVKTNTGVLKGKYAYMAPEQLENHCDHRSDIYSAGVILWELLAGLRLFTGDTDWQILQRVARGDIPKISDLTEVPEELQQILNRALANDRWERFQTAKEFATELNAFAVGSGQIIGQHDLAELLEELRGEDTIVTKQTIPNPVYGRIRRIGIQPQQHQQGNCYFRGLELNSDHRNMKIVLVFSDTLGPDLYNFPISCWEGAHLVASNLNLTKQHEDGSLICEVTPRSKFMLDMDSFAARDEKQTVREKNAKVAGINAMVLAAGGIVNHAAAGGEDPPS